jgi:RNA polymerase sigma factor (sigma-70 family)
MPSDAETLADRFYQDLRPGLIAYFIRRIGSRSEAEDLVQDVYVRLMSRPATAPRDWHAYVFQVAANLLRDRARRAVVRDRYVALVRKEPSLNVDVLDPHRVTAGREALQTLLGTLHDLPERTRQIFLLYRYEQISRQVIAESFGISVSAVEKHVYRAMARLSEGLGEKQ